MLKHNSSNILSLSLISFLAGTILINLIQFRPIASFFNGSDSLYLLSAFLLVIRLMRCGVNPIQMLIKNNPFFFMLLIFLWGSILSLINSSNIFAALIIITNYVFLLGVWIPTGIYLFDDLKKIKLLIHIVLIASIIPMVPAISDYFFKTSITIAIDSLLNLNLPSTIPHAGRFGSIVGHPNEFGLMLVVAFPISLWKAYSCRHFLSRGIGLIICIAIWVCSLITGSRSTMAAIFIQVLVFSIMNRGTSLPKKIIKNIFFMIIFSVTLISTIAFRPIVIFQRFIEMANSEPGEYEPDFERIESINSAFKKIRENAICGIGVENVGPSLKLPVHNTIIRLWASIGVSGLIFALLFYLKPWRTGRKIYLYLHARRDIETENMFVAVMCSTAGWMIMDMVQPLFHNRIKFITLILLFSIYKLSNTELA